MNLKKILDSIYDKLTHATTRDAKGYYYYTVDDTARHSLGVIDVFDTFSEASDFAWELAKKRCRERLGGNRFWFFSEPRDYTCDWKKYFMQRPLYALGYYCTDSGKVLFIRVSGVYTNNR